MFITLYITPSDFVADHGSTVGIETVVPPFCAGYRMFSWKTIQSNISIIGTFQWIVIDAQVQFEPASGLAAKAVESQS